MPAVTVGIIGAGNVIWAYFQVLDRLLPRGLARMGPTRSEPLGRPAYLRQQVEMSLRYLKLERLDLWPETGRQRRGEIRRRICRRDGATGCELEN